MLARNIVATRLNIHESAHDDLRSVESTRGQLAADLKVCLAKIHTATYGESAPPLATSRFSLLEFLLYWSCYDPFSANEACQLLLITVVQIDIVGPLVSSDSSGPTW